MELDVGTFGMQHFSSLSVARFLRQDVNTAPDTNVTKNPFCTSYWSVDSNDLYMISNLLKALLRVLTLSKGFCESTTIQPLHKLFSPSPLKMRNYSLLKGERPPNFGGCAIGS
mmetsp:Transcript_20882/g.34513  ORF Transcript_20882/g.34513 Transcript_20882/m.34513 type:complete len:113 (+) Transcript_20882:1421-1759(+)